MEQTLAEVENPPKVDRRAAQREREVRRLRRDLFKMGFGPDGDDGKEG